MSGKKKETSESTTTPVLPEGLSNAYNTLTSAGSQLFNRSQGDQYASTYTPQSAATQAGAGLLAERGAAGMPFANEAISSIAGMLSSALAPGAGQVADIATGARGISAPGTNPYEARLADFGSTFDADFARLSPKVTTAAMNALNTRGLAGMAPRIETGVLSDRLGGLAGDLWSRDRDRQFAGLQSAAGLAEAGMDRGIGVEGANIANTMSAAGLGSDLMGADASRRLAAAGALPGLAGYQNQDIGQLLASGAITDQDAQARQFDQAAAQNYAQDRPWETWLQFGQGLGLAAPTIGQTSKGIGKVNTGMFGPGSFMSWAFPNGLGIGGGSGVLPVPGFGG